jgi:hypothetical protein
MCFYIFKKVIAICIASILTAVKEGIQSNWDTVYSPNSFNRMWILQYWIFWIILIIVVFQKYRVSKHVTFLHLSDIYRDNAWKRLKISLRTQFSSKLYERLPIDSNRSWINLFYFVKHEQRQNTLHRKFSYH